MIPAVFSSTSTSPDSGSGSGTCSWTSAPPSWTRIACIRTPSSGGGTGFQAGLESLFSLSVSFSTSASAELGREDRAILRERDLRPVRRPRRLEHVSRGRRHAAQALAVDADGVELEDLAVVVGAEDDALAVGRPGGRGGRRATRGDRAAGGPVRAHEPQLLHGRARSPTGVRDPRAVRRPGRVRLLHLRVGDAPWTGAVRVHDVDVSCSCEGDARYRWETRSGGSRSSPSEVNRSVPVPSAFMT